jgi:hypothetical protein
MKIQIDLNAKDKLETFLKFVEKRAADIVHTNNGDIIADFIDSFIVVELKRLENKPEYISQEILIPDEVLAEPLLKMKEALDGAFNSFMTEKGIQPGTKQPANPAVQSGVSTGNVSQTATAPVAPVASGSNQPRNGNGHAVAFIRKLDDTEKDIIRADFTKLNGEYVDQKKSCTALLPQMGTDISVFQVTGFVSHLHREIAKGDWTIPDMPSYLTFLEKHKKLWAQYNSPKYQTARTSGYLARCQKILGCRSSGVSTTPKFKQGSFKQKTAP